MWDPCNLKYSDLLHIFQEGCIVLKALARPLLKGQQRHFVKIVDSPNHHKALDILFHSATVKNLNFKSIELSSCNLSAIHIHV